MQNAKVQSKENQKNYTTITVWKMYSFYVSQKQIRKLFLLDIILHEVHLHEVNINKMKLWSGLTFATTYLNMFLTFFLSKKNTTMAKG